jgi:hypothetical protein
MNSRSLESREKFDEKFGAEGNQWTRGFGFLGRRKSISPRHWAPSVFVSFHRSR